jgi:hypothetical protein
VVDARVEPVLDAQAVKQPREGEVEVGEVCGKYRAGDDDRGMTMAAATAADAQQSASGYVS